jgi:type VI secretion system secreted protein VgrG
MPYSQENRLISLYTPLPDDMLLLAGFSGHEAISRLFSFHLDLLTEHGPIPFAEIIGKTVTISITQSDNSKRYINGMVSRFAQSGADARFMHYQMEVVPWTWALTRYSDCKIFHKKTVVEIIQQVFSDRGFMDFQISLSGTYSLLEYTVQYRETDFNFISRLMEQYGIFYFFQHEMGKHTMVIADSSSVYQSCPGNKSAGYNLAAGGLDADDVVNSWNVEQELRSGMYTLTDYNFITPSANLAASENTIYSVGGNSGFELFDYPGDYTNRSDGTAIAKLRMQEEEADHLIAHGSGVCRGFATGYKFVLTDHPQESMYDTYVLTEIQHVASVAGNYTTGEGSGDFYSNHFTCIQASVQFRAARLTPKPFVQGPQTAVVVGKNQDQNQNISDADSGSDGEEIWVDKYGRVIVLFPWDRKGACSCWVRVSQNWAGEGWGSITIPRVGQEVIVSFLEGDPDRPIVTGRVYNATQTVPYPLPANQTRSTFMTRSSEGGSASTYNELRFEDKAGAEQVFLRGQLDYDTNILHDSREAIGNNLSLTVAKNQMESVGGDLSSQVTGNVMETVGGDSNSNITGNLNLKTGQAISVNAGTNLIESSGQAFSHSAGTSIDLKGGSTVTIEAGVTLTLKAGSNFVMIDPSGVTIVGTMVMINSGGSAQSADCASPTSPAKPTDPDQADNGSKGTKMNS